MNKLNANLSSRAVLQLPAAESNKEDGMVSILVTMIIMVILSLIIIGFAQISRREQRQSLDRQLYSQANYAAETGINDAQSYIKAKLAAGQPIPTNTDCASSPVSSSAIVPGSNAAYSCALLNAKPTELIWQHIDTQSSVAFPFTPASASSGIVFGWQDSDTVAAGYGGCPTSVPGANAFLPQTGGSAWACEAGALRVDLTPISGGAMARDSLINSTKNFIIYPIAGNPTTADFATDLGHGSIIAGGCKATTTPRHCQVTITNAAGNYFIRIRPIYRAANIELTSQTSGIGLVGAQAVVDVTGRATDILKRLQVRVPISSINTNANSTFDYAVQSIDSFCKMYSVIPGATAPTQPIADTAPGAPDSSCSVN